MPKNKKEDKINEKIIPAQQISDKVEEISKEKVIFSFSFFNREHELFNMGDNDQNPQSIEKGWFLDLLDCLRDVSRLTRIEFKNASKYDLHPIDWDIKNINASCPSNGEQYEWWQFRINKSKGRIIGIFIDNCFHIVWLDRHHNLTNSDGYGKQTYYCRPLSLYEEKKIELEKAYDKIKELEESIETYEDLLYPK